MVNIGEWLLWGKCNADHAMQEINGDGHSCEANAVSQRRQQPKLYLDEESECLRDAHWDEGDRYAGSVGQIVDRRLSICEIDLGRLGLLVWGVDVQILEYDLEYEHWDGGIFG